MNKWVEINLANIAYNMSQIRRLVGDNVEIMPIVKANAYGHGAIEVAKTVLKAGTQRLGVASLSEGIELRVAGINASILILSPLALDEVRKAISHQLTLTISSLTNLKDLIHLNQPVKIHLKIDTGMGRLGIQCQELDELIELLRTKPINLEIEGIMSHLAQATLDDTSYTYQQFHKFQKVITALSQADINIPLKHICNSAGILRFKEMHLNLVRPGIMIYGLYPTPNLSKMIDLRPAMTFKAKIIQLRKIPAGCGISYDSTYVTDKQRLIATIPVGYADGYNRLLSNKAEVVVKGVKARLVGRVTMDFCLINVSHILNVKIGDEVTLFGEELSVDALAQICHTINYEIVCGITPRVPRVYKEEQV